MMATTVMASSMASSPCPLKNLLKSQTMHSDGTAFYPNRGASKSAGQISSFDGVRVGK